MDKDSDEELPEADMEDEELRKTLQMNQLIYLSTLMERRKAIPGWMTPITLTRHMMGRQKSEYKVD